MSNVSATERGVALASAHERALMEKSKEQEKAAREHEIAQQRLRERRRSHHDSVDKLVMSADHPLAQFTKLHDSPTDDYKTNYPLSEALAGQLDRARWENSATGRYLAELESRPSERLAAARARLAREYPLLSQAVEECCFRHPRRMERGLAYELGLSHVTIHKRKWAGLGWLHSWVFGAQTGEATDERVAG